MTGNVKEGGRRLRRLRSARLFRILLVAGVLLAVVGGCTRDSGQPQTPAAGAVPPARHVILISLDTLRPDHLGCYGNKWIRTPNIDALAAESIVMEDYMTVASTTLASHTALMTGTYPHTHGVPRNGFVVNQQNETLAEILKLAGFETAAIIGSFALHKRFGLAQGFDYYNQDFDIEVGNHGADQTQRRAAKVTDAALQYLDQHYHGGRLFLFVHYFDPHMPYDPPPPYNRMYGPGGIQMRGHPALRSGRRRPARFLRQLRRYAGEVSYLDFHLGRLVDELRSRGLLDDALLLITSDHGEMLDFGSPYVFDHGWTTYQVDIHAVCIVRLPGGAHGGARLDTPLASIDILPTILNYVGLEPPARVEGQTLDLRTLTGIAPDRVRFAEATKPWNVESRREWYNNPKPRCVRAGRYKYIETRYRNLTELFDLERDPYEDTNLLGSGDGPGTAGEVQRLKALLAEWTADASPLPSVFDDKSRRDTIRRLKALGYLQDSPASRPAP